VYCIIRAYWDPLTVPGPEDEDEEVEPPEERRPLLPEFELAAAAARPSEAERFLQIRYAFMAAASFANSSV
jgi:hypothetical protein